MPQEFRILRCYSCEIFQVDIVKKTTKWICKLCGEKQSVKKIYGSSGSAKDCRLFVQQLNTPKENNDLIEEQNKIIEKVEINESPPIKKSKWLEFVDNEQSINKVDKNLAIASGNNVDEFTENKPFYKIEENCNETTCNAVEKNHNNGNIFEHIGDVDLTLEI